MTSDFFCNLGNGLGRLLFAMGSYGKEVAISTIFIRNCSRHCNGMGRGVFFFFNFSSKVKVCGGFKNKASQQDLGLYYKPIERIHPFKVLGSWLEERMTWRVHLEKIFANCNNLLMSCEILHKDLHCCLQEWEQWKSWNRNKHSTITDTTWKVDIKSCVSLLCVALVASLWVCERVRKLDQKRYL